MRQWKHAAPRSGTAPMAAGCDPTAPRVLSDAQRSLWHLELLHVFVLKSRAILGDMQ
ncbi:hypothetical protein SJ05684_c36170 [Sinorhizobium sojae CCBAU 05684]|uniref:Uncharacterized protein n=1 Tax=Sinorhizobium sojae CCBAU 05684 TaxID=716928 RepID=A0A249PGE4_9HYPH|nr:hypothetical protein SJ05684_c36170 [Sinorhizobium sojae CCBAU 05684]